jgi:hypothetical protein
MQSLPCRQKTTKRAGLSDLSMVKTAWHRDGEEQYGVRAWARRLGILLGSCASTMEQGASASPGRALLQQCGLCCRGCTAVIVRSISETRGWQPRLRMAARTGFSPCDYGRQYGIEVALLCVRSPRRCHVPEGRTPRGGDRARRQRYQRSEERWGETTSTQ